MRIWRGCVRVTVLLDTHILIWAMLSPEALSGASAAVIADEGNTILISAACVWEIATKVRIGKMPGAEALERDLIELIHRAGYSVLPIEAEHALRAGRLPAAHRDPFDRMIAAQALALDLPLLSRDEKMDRFGVRRIA